MDLTYHFEGVERGRVAFSSFPVRCRQEEEGNVEEEEDGEENDVCAERADQVHEDEQAHEEEEEGCLQQHDTLAHAARRRSGILRCQILPEAG